MGGTTLGSREGDRAVSADNRCNAFNVAHATRCEHPPQDLTYCRMASDNLTGSHDKDSVGLVKLKSRVEIPRVDGFEQ